MHEKPEWALSSAPRTELGTVRGELLDQAQLQSGVEKGAVCLRSGQPARSHRAAHRGTGLVAKGGSKEWGEIINQLRGR